MGEYFFEKTVENKLRLLSGAAIGLAIAMGALVLLGWAFNLRPLIELIPTRVVMNPMTALAFLLTGAGLLRLNWLPANSAKGQDPLAAVLAGAVILFGALRLCDHFVGLDFHIERVLFPAKLIGTGN